MKPWEPFSGFLGFENKLENETIFCGISNLPFWYDFESLLHLVQQKLRMAPRISETDGAISKAEYLGAAARDGSAAGEASQRQVAAEEMNSLIEDALVTALGGGGKGVVDADLARQCLVALIDLQMASSDVVQVLIVTPPCGICSLC